MFHCSTCMYKKCSQYIFQYMKINFISREVSLLFCEICERDQSNIMTSSDRNYSTGFDKPTAFTSLTCVLTICKNAVFPTRRSSHLSSRAISHLAPARCAACNGPRASRRLFPRGCYLVGSTYSREQ